MVKLIPLPNVDEETVVNCPTLKYEEVALVKSAMPMVLDAEFKFWMVDEARVIRFPVILILPKPGAIEPDDSAPTDTRFAAVVKLFSVFVAASRASKRAFVQYRLVTSEIFAVERQVPESAKQPAPREMPLAKVLVAATPV